MLTLVLFNRMMLEFIAVYDIPYCTTHKICGIKGFNENDVLAHFNFGMDDIPLL